ncbi:MAG: hypothetical protein LH477_01005 [Nocardioides sp.]|nr:hypothetical protein [Nocardioides sp.]
MLLAGCGGSTSPDTASLGDSTVPVPAGLEDGCPPDDTPLRLAAGDLPTGVIGVRLCPGAPTVGYDGTRHGPFVQPVADELTTGVEPLVDLVNGLPEHEPGGCPSDGGPLIVYWFRYPDGDARAVAYGERGCHTLTVGEELQREGGERLAQAFAGGLLSQRAQATPPAPTSDAGPECPLPPFSQPVSMLPQTPPDMIGATWCEGVGRYRLRSATVPPPLLRSLNDGLLGKPVQGRDKCKPVGYGQFIEGVNAWGDRVSYAVLSDCRVYARVGYGRDTAIVTFEAAPDLINALKTLTPTDVQRWSNR